VALTTDADVAADILVIGAGVIGLTTAIRLLESGRRVRVVFDRDPATTPSFVAPGTWFPHAVERGARSARWGARTFEILAAEATRSGSVVLRDSLMLYREDPGRQWWVDALPGPVQPARAGELPHGYTHGLRFTAPQAFMPEYLDLLAVRVRRLGGSLTRRHIATVAVAAEEAAVVINCSGLGARDLAGDTRVYPIRGQVVRVANPGLTLSMRDEGHPEGRTYVHPRRDDCILGGTAERGEWDLQPDPGTAASILRRCTALVPALDGARVLEHQVGLRPGRDAVRLERERVGSATVVHNYGHGGSGVTLCWGCAEEVVGLLG
jgi:D-amino-acid oxidase